MPSRPHARSAELIVEHHGDELLVYDRTSEVAHCLTRVAARVWQSCDGETELEALVASVAAMGVDGDPEEVTLRALAELEEKRLLDVAYEGRTSELSRRQMMGRLAGVGMAAVAVPLVVSAAAPNPAAAASPPCVNPLGVCVAGTNNTNGNCCGTVTCTQGIGALPVLGVLLKHCNNNINCLGSGHLLNGLAGETAAQCCSTAALALVCT
jgi:hypothetical protein